MHAKDTEAPAMTDEQSYLATVHDLQTLARRAPRVTQQDILEIASMPVDDMRRRAIVARDWHRLFAQCLDGLPALQKFGAAPDGCWDPGTIRRAVEGLLAASAAQPGVMQQWREEAMRLKDALCGAIVASERSIGRGGPNLDEASEIADQALIAHLSAVPKG